jgi:hypothetical protein
MHIALSVVVALILSKLNIDLEDIDSQKIDSKRKWRAFKPLMRNAG